MHKQPISHIRSVPAQKSLGRAVRLSRACRALSQEQLGVRSGLHRNYVGAIERGEINPTLGTLLRLARGLRLSLVELISLYTDLEEERQQDLRREIVLGVRPADRTAPPRED